MPASKLFTARIEELSRRIQTLEERGKGLLHRKMHFVAIAAAFLLGGFLVGPLLQGTRLGASAAQEDPRPPALVCSSLKIVDERGQTLLFLGADEDGGMMKILARDGKQRMFLGIGSKMGGGVIGLQDPAGRYRTVWDVNTAGLPALSMQNAAGKNEVFLGTSAKGQGGLFNLNDSQGRSRVILDLSPKGNGALGFYNADRKMEAFLGASEKGWGGLLNLNGPDGTHRMIMDIGEKGDGRMGVFNRDHHRELFLGSAEDGSGGLILVNDPSGQVRLFLEVNRDGAGYIQARDRGGALRAELK